LPQLIIPPITSHPRFAPCDWPKPQQQMQR